MKNFSTHRFGLLMRNELTGNRTALLRALGIMLIVCFAVLMFSLFRAGAYGFPDVSAEEAGLRIYYSVKGAENLLQVIFLFSVLVIFPSSTCSNLGTKQKRIAAIMLPATQTEKFLARLLVTAVVYPALYMIAVVVADALRLLLFSFLPHSLPAVFPAFFASMGENVGEWCTLLTEGEAAAFFAIPGVMLMVHALFLLGSSLFRRHAAVWTFLLILAGQAVINAILILFSPAWQAAEPDVDMVAAVAGAVCWAVALTCYWLALNRYKRIQVIPRKYIKK